MGFWWESYGIPMGFLQECFGISMGFRWDFDGNLFVICGSTLSLRGSFYKISDACVRRFFLDSLVFPRRLYGKTYQMCMILASIFIVWSLSF